jgi:hypothetical protein
MGKYPILYAEFMNKRTYFKQLCAKNRHLKKLRAEPFLEAELINSQPNLVRLSITCWVKQPVHPISVWTAYGF